MLHRALSAVAGASSAPEKREDKILSSPSHTGGGNRSGSIDAAACLTARGHKCDFEVETFVAQPIAASLTRGAESAGKGGYAGRRQEDDTNLVAHSLRAEGFDASEDGTGRGTPLVPVAYQTSGNCGAWETGPITGALDTNTDPNSHVLLSGWAVRRLTPTECERLMGVPDGFTAITYRGKPAADGPRYRALGNSQAANNMRWIAHGLSVVMRIAESERAAA